MKRQMFLLAALFMLVSSLAAKAQPPDLKKETITSKVVFGKNSKVAALKRPANKKNKPAVNIDSVKSRGDIYGADYSDIVIANESGYYVDIYVNNKLRGTIAPHDKRVTWAIPGQNTLYAKAVFDDGTYSYWGPITTFTGFEYTWVLSSPQ